MSLTNEEIISRIKAMSSKKKKQDEIEEDSINNEIATIIEYLEELDETQDDYLDIANKKYSDYDYHNVSAIVSESRSLITKIKESLNNITSKNLFNRTINSNNVTINYYCQDPSQYPTPNIQSDKHDNVEIIYHNKE